jgi:hypothetical protein
MAAHPLHRLAAGYSAQFKCTEEPHSNSRLREFEDATIFQTWAGAAEVGARRSIHQLLLKRDGEIVASAIAKVRVFSVLNFGFASVYQGPIWRAAQQQADPQIFRQAIRALRNEFVCRRGLMLRIFPLALKDEPHDLQALLLEEGFRPIGGPTEQRLILMDLRPTLDEIRAGMSAHGRRNLRTAERNNLDVTEGSEPAFFDAFAEIYRQTLARKKIARAPSVDAFKRLQMRLSPEQKMKVMLCTSGPDLCAGTIYSCIGEQSLFLFSAISERGLSTRGAFLLHWRMIQASKLRGATVYNLDGVDPEGNPGSYRFKTDIAGIHGRDVVTLGRFDAAPGSASYRAMRFIERWSHSEVRDSQVAPALQGA